MLKSLSVKALLACLLISASLTVIGEESAIKKSKQQPLITTSAPEGFDDLLQPQLSLLDIFVSGRLVGSSMARYTQAQVTFEKPFEVLQMIPALTQPDKLLAQLMVPMSANPSLVCYYRGQPDCGILLPEDIAIIFDESQLRVDIFVNPKWLKQTLFEVDKYLPASTSGAGMINAMSLVASGGESREDVYTARLNSLFSYDNYRLIANLEKDEQNDSRLDQLSVIYEQREMRYQLGTFQTFSHNGGFYNQRDFVGLRVQTTLDSRTDLEQVSGSRLFVFLNERSRIEVYKDGQIIDTAIYPAGNIELDSRDFPSGGYNVELKIIGDSGRVRTEQHFYSKSLHLPPIDESLFFLELGYAEDERVKFLPQASSESLSRFGYIDRPTDYFGWSASLVKNSAQQSLELGSFWLADHIELQTIHFLTDDHETANYYAVNYRHPNFIASATYRRSRAEALPLIDEELRLLDGDSRQTSINLGVPLANSIVNLFYRTSERQEQDNYRAIGVSWRKNIYRSARLLIDLNMEASKENDERQMLLGVTMRFNHNRLNLDSNLNYRRQSLNQQSQHNWDKSVRISHNNPESSIGAISNSIELNQSIDRESAMIQSSIANDFGAAQAIIERQRSAQDGILESESTSYSLTSHFNLATDGQQIAFGGQQQYSAGVMVDLSAFKQSDVTFSVIIDDVERALVTSGSNMFIPLPPYQTYQLVLSSIGSQLVQFDDTPRTFTLYPGNVETFRWHVDLAYVVVMQLIDDEKNFANAKLKNSLHYARTDDLGWVQLEVTAAGDYLFEKSNGESCLVKISREELADNVNFLDKKNCIK